MTEIINFLQEHVFVLCLFSLVLDILILRLILKFQTLPLDMEESKEHLIRIHRRRNYSQGFEDGFKYVVESKNENECTKDFGKSYKYVEGFENGINLGLKYRQLSDISDKKVICPKTVNLSSDKLKCNIKA